MRTVMTRTTVPQTVAVNQAIIANADIAREVQNHGGATPGEAWEQATRALVVRELLLQRARTLGVVATPRTGEGLRETDEEALLRALLELEVRTPVADETACRRYYQANRAKLLSPDLFEPQHILFRAARDDATAYAQAVARAEVALGEVTADPDRFENLARAVSDCPSASEGGRLGQIARGDTTPEFEAALLPLLPGQTCRELVHTRYGVHVLRLDRKVSGQVLPLEQVRERIGSYLEECAWRRAAAQYVALLAGQAEITGLDMPGPTSPLVQ